MLVFEKRNDKEYADRYQKLLAIAKGMQDEQKEFAYHGLIYRATAMQAHAGGSSDIWRLEAARAAGMAELFSDGDKTWKNYLLRNLFFLGEADEVMRLTSDYQSLPADDSSSLFYRAWMLEAIGSRDEIVDAYRRLAALDPDWKETAESSLQEVESDGDVFSSDVGTLLAKLKTLDKKENESQMVTVNKRICRLGDGDAIEQVCDTVFPKDKEASFWQMFDAHLLALPLLFVPNDKIGVLRELFRATSNSYCAATIGGALLRKGDDSDARMLLESTKIADSDKFKIFAWGNREQLKTVFDSFENAMKEERNYCFELLGRVGGDAAAKRIIDIGMPELAEEGKNAGHLLQTGSGIGVDFIEKNIVRKKNRKAIIALLDGGTNLCADARSFDILKDVMTSGDSQLESMALKSAATIAHLDAGLYKKIKDVAAKDPVLNSEFETIRKSGYVVQVS
jgi:hypothetical protein